jgi:hypothetical protein
MLFKDFRTTVEACGYGSLRSQGRRLWGGNDRALFAISNSHYRHCERKRSNPWSRKVRMDCFVAEFIIGPAKGRTRWLLAMTSKHKSAFPRHNMPE